MTSIVSTQKVKYFKMWRAYVQKVSKQTAFDGLNKPLVFSPPPRPFFICFGKTILLNLFKLQKMISQPEMCFVTNDLPKEISYCLLPRRHISHLEVHGKYSFISFSPLQRIWASLGDRWLTFASPFQRRRLLASWFGWDQQTILFALPHAEKGAAVSTGGLWVQSKGAWNHEGCKISVQLVSCLTLHAGLGQIWKHAKGIWLPLFDLHFPQAH